MIVVIVNASRLRSSFDGLRMTLSLSNGSRHSTSRMFIGRVPVSRNEIMSEATSD